MRDDIKQWVEALRSGNYKQGKNALCNPNNEMCCLGVYCDALKFAEVEKAWADDRGDKNINPLVYEALWYKLDSRAGGPLSLDVLIIMNDRGRSFDQIADAIEEMVNA